MTEFSTTQRLPNLEIINSPIFRFKFLPTTLDDIVFLFLKLFFDVLINSHLHWV